MGEPVFKRMQKAVGAEISAMRQRAAAALANLDKKAETASNSCVSWVSNREYNRSELGPLPHDRARFDHFGFLHIKDFAAKSEVSAMIERMGEILAEWEPTSTVSFRTDSSQESAQGSTDYFMSSSDKVHIFTEPGAVDETGALLEGVEKHAAVNKAGHGMHVGDPVFREYSTSLKVGEVARSLGWEDAVIPQSMYIFKQPRIGGEITSHQDSSFLFTEPKQSCLGMWLALHDATLENGCLWLRPGSHREPVRRKYIRREPTGSKGDSDVVMVFEDQVPPESSVPWEGSLPEGWWPPPSDGLFDAGFIPVECSAGDLLVFAGQLDHLSLPNLSQSPRHTFQLHLVEGPKAGIKWSDSNWLQYDDGRAFMSVTTESAKSSL